MTYSVGWGNEVGDLAHRCETAREALAFAEERKAADSGKVVVTDLTTREPVPLDTLTELAEQEAVAERRPV
jgi:hypothetical protein